MAARQFQLDSNGKSTLSSGCVDPLSLSARSGDEIPIINSRHLHVKGTNFGAKISDTPASGEYFVHRAIAPGTIKSVNFWLATAGSTTSIAYDFKKNGTTILSGVVTITNSTGNGVQVAGSILSANYVAGDVFTMSQTVTSSTGAQGPVGQSVFDELGT